MEVLSGVSLHAEQGITALLGANGAGKSSLLRAISGLHPISKGKILFSGTTVHVLKPYQILRLGIVHVPEGRHVFPGMTVEENLLLGAYSRKDRGGIPQELKRVYELFPRLWERRTQPAGTLSGGEQQMLALGRGIMSRPKLLLLDEPTMGLSPRMVQEIAALILTLKESGIPILLVEQNASVALDLADRGYVLRNGRVILSGDAAELRCDPAVVNAYLGSDALL